MSSSQHFGLRPNRSAFIREILGQDPAADYKKVNQAWLAAGNSDPMPVTLYYQIKAKMGLNRGSRRQTPAANGQAKTAAMAAPLGPDAGDPTAAGRRELKRVLTSALGDLSYLENRARKYRHRVKAWSWDSHARELSCPVQGSQYRPYRVVVVLPPDFEERDLIAYCTCPASGSIDACKHVYAALEDLLARTTLGGDPALNQALRRETPVIDVSLNLLEALDVALRKQEAVAVLKSHETKRLTWRIGADSGATGPSVEAYEQTRMANNEWSAGRRITVDTLWSWFAYPSTWRDVASLTPVDINVLHALRRNTTYAYAGGRSRGDELATIEAMVGHPLVFWADAPTERVDVRTGELALTLQPVAEGVRLELTIDGESVTSFGDRFLMVPEQGGIWLDRKSHRVIVARTRNKALESLLPRLASIAVVPTGQTSQLLERLVKLERFVRVSAPDEFRAADVTAAPEPVLRLEPFGMGGMRVHLRFRTFPGGEPAIPGEGDASTTIVTDGKWQTIRRDLEQERAGGLRLAEELGLRDGQRLVPWTWHLPTDDAALDFIASLRERNMEGLTVEWPAGHARTVVGTLSASALRVRIDDRRDWFGLSGHIELDGAKVSIADILKAVQRGQSYVSLGDGKWAKIEAEFRKRLEALSDVVHSHPKGLEIDRTAFAVVDELENAAREMKVCRSWQKMVDRLRADDSLDAEPPISVQADLRPYQVEGFRWLRKLATWGVGACLADDMGLGKTLEALAILVERAESGPALVLTPASVGFNWMAETERFAPTLRPIYYRETDRENIVKTLRDGDLLIVSYGLLHRDIDLLASRKWGTIVLDEAQNVKNSQTRTAQAVRQLDADWRLALTGTPVENHLGELWSIFRAISPGLLGSWERFKERFADPIERGQDFDRQQALARVLRPFLLRRTKEEVLKDLPSRMETQCTVELSKAERKRYEDARLAALLQLADGDAGEDKRFQVLAALTRLRQLACHPRLVDASWKKSSAKLECLMELIDEIREGGHRALVFSQFVQHLALIREALDKKGIDYQYLDGKTPVKERKTRVEAFQSGKGELFLISLKAGGTGLNLTGADYVIHMDPWWNPAVEDQATDRAHRIGQTKPVTVYRIVAKGTIEEQILSLHQEKRDLIAGVLDGSDRAAKLSTEQLVDLIRGREEAVAAIA